MRPLYRRVRPAFRRSVVNLGLPGAFPLPGFACFHRRKRGDRNLEHSSWSDLVWFTPVTTGLPGKVVNLGLPWLPGCPAPGGGLMPAWAASS